MKVFVQYYLKNITGKRSKEFDSFKDAGEYMITLSDDPKVDCFGIVSSEAAEFMGTTGGN